jgi:hypothetical protein
MSVLLKIMNISLIHGIGTASEDAMRRGLTINGLFYNWRILRATSVLHHSILAAPLSSHHCV